MRSRQLARSPWAAAWVLAAAAALALSCAPSASDSTGEEAAQKTQLPTGGRESPDPEATPDPKTAETPASDPLRNTLRWRTASEVDNFGFDVYRGESEEGPFERLTDEPIVGAGTTDEPQTYVWIDPTNDPAKGYYYYVESISMSNVRQRFTPVFYAKPKLEATDALGGSG